MSVFGETLTRRMAGLVVLVALGLAAAALPLRTASAEADRAAAFVKEIVDEGLPALTDESLPLDRRKAELRRLVDRTFDVERVGQLVLGRYWRQATPDERARFLELLKSYVIALYASRFERLSGVDIEVTGHEAREGRTLVRTAVAREGASPAEVVWQVERVGDRFAVTDLVIEGVSLVVTQRSEFGSVIERGGGEIQALLDRLQEMVERERAREGS